MGASGGLTTACNISTRSSFRPSSPAAPLPPPSSPKYSAHTRRTSSVLCSTRPFQINLISSCVSTDWIVLDKDGTGEVCCSWELCSALSPARGNAERQRYTSGRQAGRHKITRRACRAMRRPAGGSTGLPTRSRQLRLVSFSPCPPTHNAFDGHRIQISPPRSHPVAPIHITIDRTFYRTPRPVLCLATVTFLWP